MEAAKLFKGLSNKELIGLVKSIEKERASQDFTIPLFRYLKGVVEKEWNVKILIKEPNSMLDAEL